ncbi:prepilin peptidase [Nocardioides mangrovicus]|uniref:Prepilin peptidase n=1 Tax=Nocardioides mangrovicus TaxID=2478913 RepID=A0A3L8P677_9ACTN|nr:A24 family peptidase [Nocardioides mangrovicus]RLV50203.1 prepilin peptidase [Nocardioides mangrovicus]
MDHVWAALLCAALAGGASWFVPRLVAAVPEPVPEPQTDEAQLEAEADVASNPGEPGGDPTKLGSASQPSGNSRGFAGHPAKPPPRPAAPADPPKPLYLDLAARPDLAPWSALAGALAGVLFGAVLGFDWALLFLVPFVPLGVALGYIDWHTRLLPTWLIAPAYPALVVLVLLAGVLSGDWSDVRRAAFGWLVIGGFYLVQWLISPRIMGYGDVRLAGLLGIMLGYLGWSEIVVGLFAPILGQGLPQLLVTIVRRRRPVARPFGPAMLVASALVVAIGPPLGQWYAGRIGL